MPYDSENMIQFHKKHSTHSPTSAVYTDTSLLNMLVEDTRNDKMICALSYVILAENGKFYFYFIFLIYFLFFNINLFILIGG